MHTSSPSHTVLFGHGVWSATFVNTQPVAGLQSSILHGLWLLHSSGVPGTHCPKALHSSSPLQRSLSAQGVPAGTKSQSSVQHVFGSPLSVPASQASPGSTTPLPQTSRVKV